MTSKEIKDLIKRINLRIDTIVEGFRFATERQPSLVEFFDLVSLALECEPFLLTKYTIKKSLEKLL